MQKQRINKNVIFDKLHRGVVYTCIGVTLCGTFVLGMRVYRYLTVVKPARKEAELKMIREGAHDNAPELKY